MDFLEYGYMSTLEVYFFVHTDYFIAIKIHKSTAEFRDLMINKFNAKSSSFDDDDIEFKKEKDIKTTIKYLDPIIESYLIMNALTK